jgi:hypothetical protein
MLVLFLTTLATQVVANANLPFTWPSGMPQPVAYYWFNEGSGKKLKESVSNNAEAGYVDYEVADQPGGVYPGETWIVDENFGNVFQCGNSETLAKDVLRLEDVDYGSTGKFTINWWIHNPIGSDFPIREREQLFGHGDAQEITNAPNQIHVQLENLHLPSGGEILTILGDGNDFQSCVKDGAVTAAQLAGTNTKNSDGTLTNPQRELVEQQTGMDVFPATTCSTLMADLAAEGMDVEAVKSARRRSSGQCIVDENTTEVQQCNRVQRARSIKSNYFAEDGAVLGTVGITDDDWHMFTITTHPDGSKGFVQYLDGVARAATPYVSGVGQDNGYPGSTYGPQNGGDPIDPVGPFRFCGREKPGDWSGEAGARFDEERYSNVRLAHFSVYSDAMTAAQVEELRQEYLKKYFANHKTGYTAKGGACRGPGGANDKVESKYKTSMTLDACAKECNDNSATCKGFAYSPNSDNGYCLIYGPGFAGACSDTAAGSPTECSALGTCSLGAKNAIGETYTEESCGTCSSSGGGEYLKATCEGVGETWTAATWTSAGATWNGPTGGWLADYHPSNLVVGVSPSTDFTCYDVDRYDDHPQCTGTIAAIDPTPYRCTESDVENDVPGCASTSDHNCTTSSCGGNSCGSSTATVPLNSPSGDCDGCAKGCGFCDVPGLCAEKTGDCARFFWGKTKEQKSDKSTCPAGCTYTPAVKGPKVKAVHEPTIQFDGWKHFGGVCRSGDLTDDWTEMKVPNNRYTNKADTDGVAGPPSQTECKDFCAAEDDCIAYSHGTAWCLIYGPGLDDTTNAADWVGQTYPAMDVTQTKNNPSYICGVKCSKESSLPILKGNGCPSPSSAKSDDPIKESVSQRGAMVALALWLTIFLQ